MAQKFTSVDEYIATFTGETHSRLKEIRRTIQKAFPKATETIHYNIPAYREKDMWIAYFSGYAKHVSLALGGPIAHIVKQHASELKPYKTSASAIQFQHNEALPAELIVKLIQFRITQKM